MLYTCYAAQWKIDLYGWLPLNSVEKKLQQSNCYLNLYSQNTQFFIVTLEALN